MGADEYDTIAVDAGRIFLYYGHPTAIATTPAWTAEGTEANARFGQDVDMAGDLNGDGTTDMVVGEIRYSHGEAEEGRATVYYTTFPFQVTDSALETTVIHYTYDDLYRLTQADYTGAVAGYYEYQYDAVGNRISYTNMLTGTSVTTYTYNSAYQLTSIKESDNPNIWFYEYDENGNQLRQIPNGLALTLGEIRYQYNQRNQLIQVDLHNGIEYAVQAMATYDGLGNRLQSVAYSNGTPITITYVLDAQNNNLPLAVNNSNENTILLYGVTGIGEYRQTWDFYLGDAQSSVRQMSNVDGSLTLVRTYDPFGQIIKSIGSETSLYGFASSQTGGFGLLFQSGFYYDPSTGRLLSPQPNNFDPRHPSKGLNPYIIAIVFANPGGLLLLLNWLRRKQGKQPYPISWLIFTIGLTFILTLSACQQEPSPVPPFIPSTETFPLPPTQPPVQSPTQPPTQTLPSPPTSSAPTSPPLSMPPTATCTPTPPHATSSPTSTSTNTPTSTPSPYPTLPANIEWLPDDFKITHYTFSLESDPRYANDEKISVPGLPEDKKYRRGFIFGGRGILQQGTGLAEDGQFITIDWGKSVYDPNNVSNNVWYYKYGIGRPVEAWRTVATKDPRLQGKWIVIETYKNRGLFLVNDTGGDLDPINHIDVFVGALTIDDAESIGIKQSRVGIVR